eukprot:jgi/Chlat1/1593/Chrsp124S01865
MDVEEDNVLQMEGASASTASTSNRIWVLCCYGMIFVLAMEAVMSPFFSLKAGELQASPLLTASALSAAGFAVMVTSAPSGLLCARYGRRAVLCGGVLLLCSATLLFGLVPLLYSNVNWMFVTGFIPLAVAQGAGSAATKTAIKSLLASTYVSKTGQAMGVLETVLGVGFMFGSPLGGLVYDIGGFTMLYTLCSVMPVMLLAVSLRYLPADQPGTADINRRPSLSRERLTSFLTPSLIAASAALTLTAANFGFFQAMLPPHLKNDFELRPAYVGLVFGVAAVAYAAGSLPAGKLSDRMDRRRVIFFGMLLSCLGMVGIALSTLRTPPPVAVLIFAMLFIGLGGSVAVVPVLPFMLDCVDRGNGDKDLISAVSGAYGSLFSLGGALGPLAGGLVTAIFGFQLGTAVYGLIIAAGAFVLLVPKPPVKSSPLVVTASRFALNDDEEAFDFESDYETDSNPLLQSKS